MRRQSGVHSSIRGMCVLAGLLLLSISLFAQNQTLLFRAGAYGSYAFVGQVVKLGKTAPVGVGAGCGTTQVGASQTGTVVSANLSPLVTTGIVNTSASSSSNLATGSSDVHQVNLLAGLITADEIMSVSTTSDNGGSLTSSGAGSNLVNLVVAGIPVTAVPAPNTAVDLPLFGHVVLNEQIQQSHGNSVSLTVNMIHVYITVANPLGIPANTQIIVADANSGLTAAGGPAVLDGMAFGTRVNVGSIVRSSPTAPVSVGCLGTNGKVKTSTIVSLNLTPVLTSGTVSDTAQGTVTESEAASQTSSTVQSLNLLSGLVTADVIQAAASGSTTDGVTFNFSDSGSNFVNLQVAGHPEITSNVAANTQVEIAGLGTLWLHRVITTKDNVEVRMIELNVSQSNSFGLKIGTDIRVADAEASLHSNVLP